MLLVVSVVLAPGLTFTVGLIQVAHVEPPITMTVNTTADTIDLSPGEGICANAGGNCSLRAAIMEANADPGSTIQFDGSLNGTPIVLTRPGNDYTANSGDLDINASTTITGNGASNTFIGGDGDGKADPGETIR